MKQQQSDLQIDRLSWFLLGFLTFVWGCSFILIKKSLIAFTPVQLACMRLGIAAIAFSPFIVKYRHEIDWSKWKIFLAIGATGSGIPAFLFFFAQTEISSSIAGLLNSLTPIWTFLIGVFIFRLHFSKLQLWGVVIGFLGAALLILLGDSKILGGNPWYAILPVIATICYAASVNMVQAYCKNTRPIIISAVSFFLTGVPLLIFLFTTDVIHRFKTHPESLYSLGAVSVLSIFGTFISSILFYMLVQRTSAVFGSTVTYLMPIVALFWGFLDGETISILHFLGMGMILIGVYISKR
ncbi:MAG: DMT family transporter [Saprospiraceae bacterium]